MLCGGHAIAQAQCGHRFVHRLSSTNRRSLLLSQQASGCCLAVRHLDRHAHSGMRSAVHDYWVMHMTDNSSNWLLTLRSVIETTTCSCCRCSLTQLRRACPLRGLACAHDISGEQLTRAMAYTNNEVHHGVLTSATRSIDASGTYIRRVTPPSVCNQMGNRPGVSTSQVCSAVQLFRGSDC